LLAATAFRVGSLYNGGGGTQYVVAQYQNGQQFSVVWGEQKLNQLCTDVKLTRSAPRPEVSRQINIYSRPFGIIHYTGEASFTCRKGDMAMGGYVFAGTQLIQLPGTGGIWYADILYGLLAPEKLSGIAAGLLSHMIASIQINPVWVMRQEKTNMDVSRIAAQTNAGVSSSIMKSWEERGVAMDKIMEEGSRTRLGIDIYADSGTGTRYTVDNHHHYYWIDPEGTVLGTDTDTSPGPSFRRMQRMPPGR
jgi:hypothetical protein